MKLIFHWDLSPRWVLECMAWHAGLMYCSMGGNLLILINNICIWTGLHPSKIFFTVQKCGFYLFNVFSFSFFGLKLLWSTALYKGGLLLPLVHQQRTGTNYVAFSLSQFMSWQDKKLLAGSTWLRTMLRVIRSIWHCQVGFYLLSCFCVSDLFIWFSNKFNFTS